MILPNGTVLYHGSYAPVQKIDLGKCSAGKDFGKGFYLTSDESQARRFIRTSLMKVKNLGVAPSEQSFGFVSAFRFVEPEEPISIYEFPSANEQWLWFVSLNRRASLASDLEKMIDQRLLTAEIVVGKVANDTTNPVITTYLNGLYGSLDSPESARTAIRLLLPERLKDQYCFLTQHAISCLHPLEVIRYDI